MTDTWPRYEPVTFSRAVNVSSEDLDILNQAQLPKDAFGVGDTVEVPVGSEVNGFGYLIRFATGFHTGIYFDPATGKVLEVTDPDWTGLRSKPINSSLGQFTRTVRAIIAAFPFYDRIGSDVDDAEADVRFAERDRIANRIGDLIREIDPPAMNADGFWIDFISDVAHGEYATKDILEADQGIESILGPHS